MPPIAVHDIELFYETVGDPADPAILLIAGLGVQLIDWPEPFVEGLVDSGHFVIMYDNRDIGLSTTFEGASHDPQAVAQALEDGQDPGVAYTLTDMANDAAGLLDALDIDAAHLVGVSMGGMIAQVTAIDHASKVLSLTSIMSTTGAPDVGQPSAEAIAAILAPAPSQDRAEIIAQNIESARIWASPDHFDEDRLRKLFEDAWDRAGGPQALNTGRHFCAIVTSPPRDEALAALHVPALIVHGTADTLIQISGGERTASCVPDSKLLAIKGMGHDLVPAFTPGVVQAITELVASTATAQC